MGLVPGLVMYSSEAPVAMMAPTFWELAQKADYCH